MANPVLLQNQAQPKSYQVPPRGQHNLTDADPTQVETSGNPNGGGGHGGGNPGDVGGQRPAPAPATQTPAPWTQQYGTRIGAVGGPSSQGLGAASQSFSDPSRLQGALPFWQSPDIMVAGQHGYDPGQTYAGQQVTGQSIASDPYIGAALNNFNLNVAPGIQNQMNAAGLGRSTAAADAMAKAQASLMPSLFQQSTQNEQQRIQNQIGAGQFSAGLSQQDLSRLSGATQFDTGLRQQAANEQQQGQQQLFQNLMQMQGQNFNQQMGAGQQLFGQGTLAQQTGQMGNQNSYQDFLRQQGLSEEAINPFGGISGLLGTVTSGK